MTPQATDKFRQVSNMWSSSLSSPMGSSSVTMTPSTTSGLSTLTGIDLVVDRVDQYGNPTPTKREYVKGVVSGTQVITLVRGLNGSTAQSHDPGAIVEVVWDAATWNDAVLGILQEHNQDGTHAAINASGLITALAGLAVSSGPVTFPNSSVSPLALSKPVKGRFYRSSDAVHPAGSWYVNTIDSTDYNLSGYVLSGGGVKVPYTGVYDITGVNGYQDLPSSTGIQEILVGWNVNNTAGPTSYHRYMWAANSKAAENSRSILLNANDILYLYEYASAANTNNYRIKSGNNTDTYSYLEIEYKGPSS